MIVLVTGGAGFIGSHLADALVRGGHTVRALDDLSNGLAVNLPASVELFTGSVADSSVVAAAVRDAEVIFHQAALGSVKRSVEHPLATDTANAHGTLTVLDAARRAGVRRVVLASSSSVYGGTAPLPTHEQHPVNPRSPYAVSKLAGELYATVFADLFTTETVVLRYFNVYGPRQRHDSPYAAVIPRWIEALRRGDRPVVNGDGHQTRDFTYVADAVAANLAAMRAPATRCNGRAYNIAGGQQRSLLDLLGILGRLLGVEPAPAFEDPRPGDVRHSKADVTAASTDLHWRPAVSLEEGLARTIEG